MKILRNTLVLGVAAIAIAIGWAEDSQTIKKDMAHLQGEWSMVSGERDGQPFPNDFIQGSKRVCKGDETTVTVADQLFMKAKFTLDPSKKPKTIDYSVTGGPYSGQRQLGMYELEGDTVEFCFSLPGQERPTAFTTKAGDGRTLSVWKREKQ